MKKDSKNIKKSDVVVPQQWKNLSERQKEILKKSFPISFWYKFLAFLCPHLFLLYARQYWTFIIACIIPIPIISIFVVCFLEELCYNHPSSKMKKYLIDNKYLWDEKDKKYPKTTEKLNSMIENNSKWMLWICLSCLILPLIIAILAFAPRRFSLHDRYNSVKEQIIADEDLKYEKLSLLLLFRPVYGRKDATMSILVFADPECAYSKRALIEDKTIQKIIKSNNNINMIYFSNSVLEWSEEKSAIIECFSQVAGDDKFYEFVEAVHKNKSSNYWNNNNNNVDFLYNLVSKYWWKKKVVQKCVESWKWLNNITNVKRWIEIKTDDEISWTPYFVIWNHLNNEVQPILWAYPIETFNEVINSMIVGNNKWL